MRVRTALLVALLAVAPAAAAPEPRTVADEVAQAIETNYFDPARAAEIATGLRDAATKGEFDALTNPDDIAHGLTSRLQPIDGHFAVEWIGDARRDAGAPPPGPRLSYADTLRRSNYGFRRIEILPGNVGLIEMTGFADFAFGKPDEPARLAVEAALRSVSRADAVIIDLRQNGGGSPAMVGYLASAFLKPGQNVYNVFHGRGGTESEAPGEPYATPMTDVPVFVVTSGMTGSAAEALPYTLQAAKRATIVGERTAGAANPGDAFRLNSGFEVFISTGSPINPVTGGNWEKTGVQPDVEVPAAEALDRATILALEAIIARGLPEAEAVEARWVMESLKAGTVAFNAADYTGTYDGVTIKPGEDTLISSREGRPDWTLRPLSPDLFYLDGEPTRRFQFERDASGRVEAMTSLGAGGQRNRLRRTG